MQYMHYEFQLKQNFLKIDEQLFYNLAINL